jgi:hypothetical protein
LWIDGGLVVSAASAVVSASGECSYVLGATVLDDVEEGCQVRWDLTVDGAVRTFTQLFDVVLHKLEPLVTDDDLVAECPPLVSEGYKHHGTAGDGTAKTLVDEDLMRYADDHWTGGELALLEGSAAPRTVRVTDFARATGTVTWETSLASAVSTDTTYLLTRTWQPEIDRAWDDLESMIRARGERPSLIVGVDDLKPLHLPMALSKVCRGLAREKDDVWWSRADFYQEQFEARWKATVFRYDADEDEIADTAEPMILRLRR